jgi:small subunit ribosomal protein S25e
VFINEAEASKIVKSSKVITIQDLARQSNVKISTANAFLKKALSEGTVKKVGGFSGHYINQPVSQ